MPLLKQFITFFGVGVAATVTDWSTFFVLQHFFAVTPVVAVGIAYCCGGTISYTLNRLHTFETDRTHAEAGWRFAVVMIVGFSLSLLFVWLFSDKIGLPPMVARVISTGIVFFWNYVAHKMWTFAEKKA
jgi:putative flippase GtrA